MAINYRVFNHETGRTAQVAVDFDTNLLVEVGNYNGDLDYYFKFQTSARNTSGQVIPVKIVTALDELAIQGSTSDSKSIADDDTPYASIKEMVEDYVFDIINGHEADQYGTGSDEQLGIDI